MVEAKTASKWVNDDKVSGDDVNFSKLKKHQECLRQVSIMQELNAFLYKHDLQGPHNTSFNGLKRQFNNYTLNDYLFDQGGRLYCQLPHNNYQSLSGHERSLITVNGEAVERDVVKSWINLSLTIGKPLERWPETSSEDAMCCLKECFKDRLGGEVIVKVSD